jgi:hypothetical protein
MCQQGEPHFDNMAVLPFSRSVPLMRVRAGDTVCDTHALEKGMQGLILSSLICLDGRNFTIQLSFN